jgi:hypothetical protein
MVDEIDIFFSYSHRDSGIARNLVSKLEDAGLRCFIAEKDVAAGVLWESRIREAILEAKRMLLLITPRSKNSLWVAAEAGAAWALEKELCACLMFVEVHELIEPIKQHQARRIETQEEVESLINELVPTNLVVSNQLTGQWVDPTDGDTVYFRQIGTQVVGFYDYGTGNRKVGVYRGTMNDRTLDYSWRWLEQSLGGQGRMTLSENGQRLSGQWWYAGEPDEVETVQYHRLSDNRPSWLSEDDFDEYLTFFKTGKP